MDCNYLGNTFQSAYKGRDSNETALLCIQKEIHMSLSKGMPTALVLLDLTSAFNTIDHDTLLIYLSARFGLHWNCPKMVHNLSSETFSINRNWFNGF